MGHLHLFIGILVAILQKLPRGDCLELHLYAVTCRATIQSQIIRGCWLNSAAILNNYLCNFCYRTNPCWKLLSGQKDPLPLCIIFFFFWTAKSLSATYNIYYEFDTNDYYSCSIAMLPWIFQALLVFVLVICPVAAPRHSLTHQRWHTSRLLIS